MLEEQFNVNLTESDVNMIAKSVNQYNNANYYPGGISVPDENVLDAALVLIHLYKNVHNQPFKQPIMRAFKDLATQNDDVDYLKKIVENNKHTEHMQMVLDEHLPEINVMLKMIKKETWS